MKWKQCVAGAAVLGGLTAGLGTSAGQHWGVWVNGVFVPTY